MAYSIAMLWQLTTTQWIVIGVVLLLSLAAAVRSARGDENDRNELWDLLEGMRFAVHREAETFDHEVFRFLSGNPLIQYEQNRIKWYAVGEIAGKNVRVVCYHCYAFGRDAEQNDTLIVGIDVPVEATGFTLERKRWLQHHKLSREPSEAVASQVGLSSRFSVYAGNADGARAVLVPEVIDHVRTWGKAKWLRLHEGALLVGRRGRANALIGKTLIEEAVGFVNAIERSQQARQQTSPPSGGLP